MSKKSNTRDYATYEDRQIAAIDAARTARPLRDKWGVVVRDARGRVVIR